MREVHTLKSDDSNLIYTVDEKIIFKHIEPLTFAISSLDGQISLKKIFVPSFPIPMGSVSKSMSTYRIECPN